MTPLNDPIRDAAPDLFRVIQNLLDSHPEDGPINRATAIHDWREARALIERIKDGLIVQDHHNQIHERALYAC